MSPATTVSTCRPSAGASGPSGSADARAAVFLVDLVGTSSSTEWGFAPILSAGSTRIEHMFEPRPFSGIDEAYYARQAAELELIPEDEVLGAEPVVEPVPSDGEVCAEIAEGAGLAP